MKEFGTKLISFDISKFPQCRDFEVHDPSMMMKATLRELIDI